MARPDPTLMTLMLVCGAMLSSCATRSQDAPISGGTEASSAGAAAKGSGQTLSFTVEDLRSDGFIELSSLRGKVVLVDFWASWCVPCRRSLPFYETLANRLGAENFAFLGISLDEERAVAQRFLEEVGTSLPMGWDAGQRIVASVDIDTMPTAFLLDRDGVVKHVHAGFVPSDEARIESWVKALVEAPRVTAAANGSASRAP